jgi:hypothetical protein
MPEYSHTLIPNRVDFVPDPAQVTAFLESLVSIGAAPLQPEMTVSKLSSAVRSLTNPFTLKTETYPVREFERVAELSKVAGALTGLDDYNVTLEGKGPATLPAFEFDFEGIYDFIVRCCLRAEVVSTSDSHDEAPLERKSEFFGRPCSSQNRLGIFHHPNTLEVIEVPNAGCARFWIEFEFGKMLFPQIKDRLDLIEPSIVEAAKREFAIEFVQGCHWCA